MARNGAGVYSLPAVYEATTGETITATQHNTPLEDLKNDANAARPVVAGGTGATNAADARTNLGLADVASSGSAADLSAGTLPSARLSGSYTGITGLGTLTLLRVEGAGSSNSSIFGVVNGDSGLRVGTDGSDTVNLDAVDDTLAASFKKLSMTATAFTFATGPVTINNTTGSTSSTTGALIVGGGVGIAGKSVFSNDVKMDSDLTAGSLSTSGSIVAGAGLFAHATSTSPSVGKWTIEAVSDSELKIKYTGSDGTVRSASLALA